MRASILGALTGRLSGDMAEALVKHAFGDRSGDSPVAVLLKGLDGVPEKKEILASLLTAMWLTPRGLEDGGQIVFEDVELRESVTAARCC